MPEMTEINRRIFHFSHAEVIALLRKAVDAHCASDATAKITDGQCSNGLGLTLTVDHVRNRP